MSRNSAQYNQKLSKASSRHTQTNAREQVSVLTDKCGMVRGPTKAPLSITAEGPMAARSTQHAARSTQHVIVHFM